jgi:protein-disulfide isomerase
VGSNGGAQAIIAAVILGLCVLGGAFMLSRSVGQATDQLAALGATMEEIKQGFEGAAPLPAREARRRGPDPDRVYQVNIENAPVRGPENAAVTLVEFSDFQCPFCARVGPTLKQIEQEYGDRVRIVFKHLPLSMHSKAPAAHAAAEAAALQGRFWEMHDRIFANQREMSEEKYLEWAGELGLDVERFKRDVASEEVKARVERDRREASSLGVSGTPAFFLNGKYLSGAKPFSEFKQRIDEELKG